MFADDVKVYMSVLSADDAATFQTPLNIISDWAQDWQLGISVNKCSVLNISKNVYSADYHICNSVLPNDTSCRDLGVLLTNDLSPYVHIGEIVVYERVTSVPMRFYGVL